MTAKILSITSKSLGGSGMHLTALAQGVSMDMQSDIVYSRSGVRQDIKLEEVFSSVYLFPHRLRFNIFTLFSDFTYLVRLLRRERYDIIHTHTSLGGAIGRVAALFTPGSAVVHTLHAFGANQFTPRPQKWLFWVIEKILDLRTHAYIAPSHFMVDYGKSIRLVPDRKVRMIHNALPLSAPSEGVRVAGQEARLRYGLGKKDIIFIFCGRLEEQKGGDILIRAVARIVGQCSFKVLMCGDGVLLPKLKRLAQDLGVADKFVWLGWQDDVSAFYAAADIFVMPSRWESFGLVFLEAMNHGLPILSTAVQAIPEVVEHGVSGLLCESGDVAALANNMLRLAEDGGLRRKLGENGRLRLATSFPYERFIQEHTVLYSLLLSKKIGHHGLLDINDKKKTESNGATVDSVLMGSKHKSR